LKGLVFTKSAHFGVMRFAMAPTNRLPTANIPNTIALAALEMSGLAPPPAPNPFSAPKIPGQVKAVAATRNAQNIVDRYHWTGTFSSFSDIFATMLATSVRCGLLVKQYNV
jgi:hypothetical protein